MTSAKRAAQFPDDMITQGNDKQLSDAWGRYCNIQQCNIESLKHVPLFWHQVEATCACRSSREAHHGKQYPSGGRMPCGLWWWLISSRTPPLPCVTFCRVVAPLRGPGQSPVLPFACCVGSLRSVGRCGRCSCWCHFRVRGAQWLMYRGCAGCGRSGIFVGLWWRTTNLIRDYS